MHSYHMGRDRNVWKQRVCSVRHSLYFILSRHFAKMSESEFIEGNVL